MEINFKTIITFLVIFAVCGFWMAKCTHGGIENAGKPDNEELKGLYKSYSFKAIKNAWLSIDESPRSSAQRPYRKRTKPQKTINQTIPRRKSRK